MGDEHTENVPEIKGIAGQATVTDLSDEDLVINFCLQNKITKAAIDELLKWALIIWRPFPWCSWMI